jgi:aminoglycoside phosphotransferase (APT) family kinase protein
MPDLASVVVEPLPGGSSAFVARLVLKGARGNERQVVFRQHTDRAGKEHTGSVAAKEFQLTRALAALGFEVARPLVLHGEHTADGPWLVVEWIDGSTSVDQAHVDGALLQMAQFLARLHVVDIGRLSVPGLTQIEDPVRSLPRYLPDDDIGVAIDRALERGVLRRPNADALLHGDFWPGNVMFNGGEIAAVLDWEDAAYGDPLVDLACARLELTCEYGSDASQRFTAHYLECTRQLAAAPLITHDLALWDVYVSAAALTSMHQWGLPPEDEVARRDTTGRFLSAAIAQLAVKS